MKFKYDSLSLSDIYKNYIQPFEEGWKLYGSQPPASVKSEARNEKHASLYDINNRKSDKSETGVSGDAFHQYCMASWDGLPVCILCGFDIDLANKSTIRFCKGCSGYAHVTCIPNPSDDWKCPFCSRTDDPYLNVSYAIHDKRRGFPCHPQNHLKSPPRCSTIRGTTILARKHAHCICTD